LLKEYPYSLAKHEHENPIANLDNLVQYTVAIRESGKDGKEGRTLGTGVIVTDDGLIVTCYHVLQNEWNKTIYDNVQVYFPSSRDIKGSANRLVEFDHPELDIAFLQLQDKKLPENVTVAKLNDSIKPGHDLAGHHFRSFGFRKEGTFYGLNTFGRIDGIAPKKREHNNEAPYDLIQLYSDGIDSGMSGSAVLHTQTDTVVGVISEYWRTSRNQDRNLGLAIPIGFLIKACPELEQKNPGLSEHLVHTNLSPIFARSEYCIKEFESRLDDKIQNEVLSKAIGLLSVIEIGSNIWEEIKDKVENQEQRAFKNLLSCIFESARETLTPYFKKDMEAENFTKEQIKNLLLAPFLEEREWESYLPDHPSIAKFRDNLALHLKNCGIKIKDIRDFIIGFNLSLNDKINKNVVIRDFYSWWTKRPELKELVEYVEEVKANQSFEFDCDKQPLKDYYIPTKAFLAPINTLVVPDENIEGPNFKDQYGDTREASKILKELLLEQDAAEWPIFIGGTWGVGKTTLCKKIASDLAQNYLCDAEVENEGQSKNTRYIPILCPLRGNIRNIQVSMRLRDTIDGILKRIYLPNREQRKNRKAVFIFDGLDEYSKGLESLVSDLDEYRRKWDNNIKAIITTRLGADGDTLKLKKKISDEHAKYVRLLPFTKDDVNNFFIQYGIIDKINYESATAPTLNWDKNQLRKPLFAWMLALIYSNTDHKIETTNNWNASKTLIYFSFLNDVIRKREDKAKDDYEYKQLPRIIAALKHIHADNLIIGEADSESDTINIKDAMTKLDPQLDASVDVNIAYKPYLIQYTGKVNFVHETFKEYYLAEYYLDAFLNSKSSRLNAVIPSENTVNFLEGLADLLNKEDEKNNKSDILKEFVSYDEAVDVDNSLRKMSRNAIKWILEDNSLNAVGDGKTARIAFEVPDYTLLWIDRWISVCVLNSLISNKTLLYEHDEQEMSELKKKLGDLILYSGRLGIPNYLKRLNNFDLSDANLIETDLSGAYFSGNKNLISTNFFYAKLTSANFSYADLSLANFWRANLKNIILQNAILFGANLYHVELRSARLESADLSYAELSGANLARSNLSDATLSGANLSHADLSGATMMNIKDYEDLICHGANLENIKTNDDKFLEYLKKGSNKPMGYLKPSSKRSVESKISLTGKWKSNDGGTYYVNEIKDENKAESTIWFLGVSNALNFVNVFKGTITNNDVIVGEWADVPLGEDMDYGELHLKTKSHDNGTIMLKVYQTGGFGATIWTKSLANKNEFRLYDGLESSYIENKKRRDLTGLWRLGNGNATYYVHQIGNIVWSLGIEKDNLVRIFRGELGQQNTVQTEWADVDRKNNGKLQHGTMAFKISTSGDEAISFQESNIPTSTFYRFG